MSSWYFSLINKVEYNSTATQTAASKMTTKTETEHNLHKGRIYSSALCGRITFAPNEVASDA